MPKAKGTSETPVEPMVDGPRLAHEHHDLRAEVADLTSALDHIRATCEAAGFPGETDEPASPDSPDPAPIRTSWPTAVLVERMAVALKALPTRAQILAVPCLAAEVYRAVATGSVRLLAGWKDRDLVAVNGPTVARVFPVGPDAYSATLYHPDGSATHAPKDTPLDAARQWCIEQATARGWRLAT
jgi:hypothetical protein